MELLQSQKACFTYFFVLKINKLFVCIANYARIDRLFQNYLVTVNEDLEGVLGLIAYAAVAVCVPCGLYILVFRRSAYFEDTMNILKRLVKKGAQP